MIAPLACVYGRVKGENPIHNTAVNLKLPDLEIGVSEHKTTDIVVLYGSKTVLSYIETISEPLRDDAVKSLNYYSLV